MAHPFENLNRRAIRSLENPMDKSTIISIYPKRIEETKPTIVPGRFIIEPGTYDNPSVLTVGSCSWWREVGEDEPLLEIPQSSIVLADSIVRDYANGIMGCDMAENMPGLFFVPGAFTVEQIQLDRKLPTSKFKPLLDRAAQKQENWFRMLVKIADVSWARTNGNPLGISDDMRLAAEVLGLRDRDWFMNVTAVDVKKCIACGQLNNSDIIVCPNCKVVLDQKRFDEMKFKFA